jgi:hypothetical protein
MHTEFSNEALEYGGLAMRALEAAGGDELAQRAERAPGEREALVAPALAELGAWDLDPRNSTDELEAAAALCRAAGHWCVPYPVAARLAGAFVVAAHDPAAPVDGLDGPWRAITLDGRTSTGTALAATVAPRSSAFVTRLDLAPWSAPGAASADVPLALVLPCFTLLGMLDRALLVTREYVVQRRQFGQTLSSFQSVQFQLTDAEVERVGLEELAKYALWSIAAGRPDALADALALRVAALEAAEIVFRVAHQLHAAIGFCDETFVSWLSRHSQPLRRLPLGLSATREALSAEVGRHGLSGLFDELAAPRGM